MQDEKADLVDGAIERAEDAIGESRNEDRDLVETEKIPYHFMDIKPGVMGVWLPCGYLDRDGNLHNEMVVREMGGFEEDILAGKGPAMERLNTIIARCTTSLGSLKEKQDIARAVPELTASDRMAALIAIRRASLGDNYPVKQECPSDKCKVVSRFVLDLSTVEIMPMQDPMVREFDMTLETGKTVKWHIMSGTDEEWLSAKQKKKEDVLTLVIMARVDEVDGKKITRGGDKKKYQKSMILLKSLSMRERHELREVFQRHEGNVDTNVDFTCPECGYEWTADMDVTQPSFFFPSGT